MLRGDLRSQEKLGADDENEEGREANLHDSLNPIPNFYYLSSYMLCVGQESPKGEKDSTVTILSVICSYSGECAIVPFLHKVQLSYKNIPDSEITLFGHILCSFLMVLWRL